jgi:hypothetical protein
VPKALTEHICPVCNGKGKKSILGDTSPDEFVKDLSNKFAIFNMALKFIGPSLTKDLWDMECSVCKGTGRDTSFEMLDI